MNKHKNIKRAILNIQIILTLFGTALALVLFFRTLSSPSILGISGMFFYNSFL